MDTPEALEKYRIALEQAMRALLPREPVGLYRMLRYHLGWEDKQGNAPPEQSAGKALRPALCLLTCEALGRPWQEAAAVAATLELIHNFSLIHDDIQDRDTERRGQETVWSVWGIPKGLWAGNVMRLAADRAIDGEGVPPLKRVAAGELLTTAYLEMIEGQYMDLEFEGRTDITVGDYLAMISRKTGALIRCAVELGALVATDDAEVHAALRVWGRHLGLAFQVRDDILGIWGDPYLTGKAIGNDIRRRKKTYPVVYGFMHAKGPARHALDLAYAADELDGPLVEQVMTVLARVGAHKEAQALVDRHTHEALEVLHRAELPADPWARRQMEELTTFLALRDK